MFFITGVPSGLISGHFPDLRAGSIVRTLSENAYFSIIFLHSSEVILPDNDAFSIYETAL